MNSVVSDINSVSTPWALRDGPSHGRIPLQNKQLHTSLCQYVGPGGRDTRRGGGL
jgi:hypothetical protein